MEFEKIKLASMNAQLVLQRRPTSSDLQMLATLMLAAGKVRHERSSNLVQLESTFAFDERAASRANFDRCTAINKSSPVSS